jgi:uncharacterized FAD-dependent dehydrogenase
MILTEKAKRHTESSTEVDPPSIDEMSQSPLRGVYWQEEMERRAAVMGGGSFVAPVQRVTDFLAYSSSMRKDIINADDDDDDYCLSSTPGTQSVSTAIPSSAIQSSYRLGVKEAPLHELYPPFITSALHAAILDFDRKMPGFISPGLLI